MILVLGSTCSGKDTLVNELVKNFNYKKIITCTTRPIREGEIQDVTYHFLTLEKFNDLKNNNKFFETTSYNVTSGETWHYGTLKKDIQKQFDNGIIILNPRGFKIYKKYFPDAFCVRLYAPTRVIRKRLYARGDDMQEAERRLRADINDFMLLETSDECNISVNTDFYSVKEIAKMVNETYKKLQNI